MALKNLNSDFERIFTQIFKPPGETSGSADPFRKFLKNFNHVFTISLKDTTEQLKAIRTSKSITKKTEGKARQDLIINSPKHKELTEKVAKKIFNEFGKLKDENTKSYSLFVTKNTKEVILQYGLEKDNVQNLYNKVADAKAAVLKVVWASEDGAKFLRLLRDGGASVNDAGTNIFDVGHAQPVKELSAAAFVKGVDSLEGKGWSDYADEGDNDNYVSDVKDTIAKKIRDDLAEFKLNFDVVDEFIVFKNGELVRKPNAKFTVFTDLETKFKNAVENQQKKAEGKEESAREIGKVLGNLKQYIQETMDKEIQKAKADGWVNREGSDSFVEALGRGLVMSKSLLPLYKNGTAKNLTKWKTGAPLKNRKNRSKPFTHTYKSKTTKHRVSPIGSMKGVKGPRREKNVESGGQDMQIAASVLRAFVNSRLTKTVQGNMGRPRLENVTGRFAESVNVVNANALGNHVHLDYTYQADPYRVFENGNQYPSGYDPRPLIEKSIREIAAAKLETKFTLRRV
jgi:hypothetical protein